MISYAMITGKDTYLLYIRNLGCKALRNLRNDFLNEGLVLHGLPRFHDSTLSKENSFWSVFCERSGQSIDCLPHNGRLNHIFPIIVNNLQDIGRFGLDLGLYWQIKIDTYLLGFEACTNITS
jgi:hypothetical protein